MIYTLDEMLAILFIIIWGIVPLRFSFYRLNAAWIVRMSISGINVKDYIVRHDWFAVIRIGYIYRWFRSLKEFNNGCISRNMFCSFIFYSEPNIVMKKRGGGELQT